VELAGLNICQVARINLRGKEGAEKSSALRHAQDDFGLWRAFHFGLGDPRTAGSAVRSADDFDGLPIQGGGRLAELAWPGPGLFSFDPSGLPAVLRETFPNHVRQSTVVGQFGKNDAENPAETAGLYAN
jgi:hypothetical protein